MDTFNFVKDYKGCLYGIYEDVDQEKLLGVLKFRFGILYLLPVIEDEILWGEDISVWVFDDINKNDLDAEEQEKVFAESNEALKKYFNTETEE